MKKTALLFVLPILIACWPETAEAQDAEIKGTIFMPAVKSQSRVSRGKAYRSRFSGKKAAQKSSSAKTSFEDVIVSATPLSFKANVSPMKNAVVYQKNATFVPRVLPVTRGTYVKFINQDKFYHNVFSLTPGSKFNIGRKPKGTAVSQRITKTGEVKLFCDIHTQMNAIILSLETPYFTRVSSAGRYSLKVPAGKYRVEVYHPDLTKVTETVEVKAKESLLQNYNLSN